MYRESLQRIEERKGIPLFWSVVWALVPLLTLGWGTWFSFTYAAIRLRDGVLAACAWIYFVVGVVSFTLVASSNNQNDWRSNLGAILALVLVAVGSAHTFAIRRRLTQPEISRRYKTGFVSHQELALAEAKTEIERRREARQILKTDPELAWQLRIGRPDLPRRYQDGGLVDANHASATVLAALPGISRTLANEIVSTRESIGGYRDLDDLSVTLGVTPQDLDLAGTFLVFLRSPVPE